MKSKLTKVPGAVLDCYSQVWFTDRRVIGFLILLCTFLAPAYGAVGLAGVVLSLILASLLNQNGTPLPGSTGLFNALLSSLAVAHAWHTCPLGFSGMVALLLIACLVTVLITPVMSSWIRRLDGLPAMSLSFVATHFVLYFLLLPMPKQYAQPVYLLPPVDFGWPWLNVFLESVAAITFVSHTVSGLLILAGLLLWSPLAVLFATAGFAGGVAMLLLLPAAYAVPYGVTSYLGFNFLFAGLALGGMWVIPSWRSLGLAIAGGALCVVFGLVELRLFSASGLPPMALVFNIVALVTLAALKQRTSPGGLELVTGEPLRPEENYRAAERIRLRFPDANLPVIRCPFAGSRTVTQSFDGPYTHKGDWQYALDFELHDASGRPAPDVSSPLADYYTTGTPLLSPGDGVVARVLDGVEDREIGENNFHQNWGNTIVLLLDSGVYVGLSHLMNGSLRVLPGQRVCVGEYLARIGNSGRSPIPHLHVQVQQSPVIGSPTIPFRLQHYCRSVDAALTHHTTGVPMQGDVIHSTAIDHQLLACFDNPLRHPLRYDVVSGGNRWSEELSCSLDQHGNYVFCGPAGDWLTACVLDGAFYALAYDRGRSRNGSHSLFLECLWFGLSRVPCISRRDAHWSEPLDPHSVRSWAGHILHASAAPFLKAQAPQVTHEFVMADTGRIAIKTQIASPRGLGIRQDLPTSLCVELSSQEFVPRISGTREGVPFQITRSTGGMLPAEPERSAHSEQATAGAPRQVVSIVRS